MAFYDVTGTLQEGSIDPYLASRRRMWTDEVRRNQAAAHRGKVWRTAAGGAALVGGAVAAPYIASMFTGGAGAAGAGGAAAGTGGAAAAPAASAGWAGVTAPTFGGAAATTAATVPSVASVAGAGGLMSRIPWGSVASQGANTLFGIYANRQASNANRDALAYQERANAEAMAFEREQMAESRRQFDQQQAAAERSHAADEQFRGAQFASSEEERLYRRRLEDEREARRAPYRQASLEALGRLPGILASGRTSPGSLGSYRRG